MHSELAIAFFGPQLEELQQQCNAAVGVGQPNRELVYGYADTANPINNRWCLLEGQSASGDPAVDRDNNEEKIASAQSEVHNYLASLAPHQGLPAARLTDPYHVVDRFVALPLNHYNEGGDVGVVEVYTAAGEEYFSAATIGVRGVATYLQAIIISQSGAIKEVVLNELDKEDLSVIEACEEVFGHNSIAAALVQGGVDEETLFVNLAKISSSAHDIVPKEELDSLLARVHACARKNSRAQTNTRAITENRITRLRNFIEHL